MKAVIRSRDDLDKFCDTAERQGVITGQPMTVTLTKFRRPRSIEQNSIMHVLFRELAEHTGYSESEIKDYFKADWGPSKCIEIGGQIKVIPKGTSEYSVPECQEMIERIYQVGAEAGCVFQERDDD